VVSEEDIIVIIIHPMIHPIILIIMDTITIMDMIIIMVELLIPGMTTTHHLLTDIIPMHVRRKVIMLYRPHTVMDVR
jgi:hypothetical protein